MDFPIEDSKDSVLLVLIPDGRLSVGRLARFQVASTLLSPTALVASFSRLPLQSPARSPGQRGSTD